MKLKTNKSMAKRIKVTKNNKFIHNKAGKNHLLTNKGKNKKTYKYGKSICKSERATVKSLILYKIK